MRIGPVLVFLIPACANVEPTSPPGRSADGGLTQGADGGPQTGPSDAAIIDGSMDAGAFTVPPEDLDACFNGIDDDSNDLTDCADAACGASAYCCVGSGTAACCTSPRISQDADFASCAGTDPRACSTSPLSWFGTPRPTLEDDRFVPNGDTIDDSGLVLGESLDPTRELVQLRAIITAPLDGCRDCLDVVALGLADRPAADDVRVVPDVAVMVRASRGDYALVVAGEVVWTAQLTDADPHDYSLTVSPEGDATLSVDGAPMFSTDVTPRRDRAALLYGRTHNRDGLTARARVTEVSLRSSGCDIPSAMDRNGSAVIPFDGVPWGARVASNPSILREGDELLVAFALDRDIHLARRAADGTWSLAGSGQLAFPSLEAEAGERLRDPELVRESDRYALYLTQETMAGPRIVRAEGETGYVERFGALSPIALPTDAEGAESPSVIDFNGARYLAIRATDAGDSVIALLTATDATGSTFVWADATLADSIVVRQADGFDRFDYDEVGDPELAVDGANILRLFYAGRRGTRWGIGTRVSGDGATWRAPVDGAVLTGSGVGHDSLWARHPSVSLSPAGMEMFYTASNGVTVDIGRAVGSTR